MPSTQIFLVHKLVNHIHRFELICYFYKSEFNINWDEQ